MARLMKNSDGFTIVEVAVTLVVIGIFSIVILMMQTQVSNISVLRRLVIWRTAICVSMQMTLLLRGLSV